MTEKQRAHLSERRTALLGGRDGHPAELDGLWLFGPSATAIRHQAAAQTACLNELDSHAYRAERPDEPGGGWPLSPSLPLRERGKGVPVSAYVLKEVDIIKACPLVDAQLAPGLPPEGLGGRLPLMEGLEGDMAYYMSDPAHCLLPEQDVSRPIPDLG